MVQPEGGMAANMIRTAFAAAVFVLLMAAPGSAQAYVGGGSLTVQPSVAAPGAAVTLTGRGFKPTTSVVFTIHSDSATLGTATADPSGSVTSTVNLPVGITAGAHTVTAAGTAPDGSSRVLTADLTVTTSASSPKTATTVPVTGSGHTGSKIVVGLALVVTGGGLLVVRRRRVAAR
jgi:LPXTG-motif cell wall-anchored protein